MARLIGTVLTVAAGALAGCAGPPRQARCQSPGVGHVPAAKADVRSLRPVSEPSTKSDTSSIALASHQEPLSTPAASSSDEATHQPAGPADSRQSAGREAPPAPAEADRLHAPPIGAGLCPEVYAIDLNSVIRLTNSNSPTVGVSRARVREAQARADAADLLWLPNLSAGMAYNRFDGRTQNQRGQLFDVSRSNLFGNGGVAATFDVSEAIFRPLIEEQTAYAEHHRADATLLSAELDAILAYFDLAQVHSLIEINAETLREGEAVLTAAVNAQEAKLDRTAGDVNRVKTEIYLRRQEKIDLQGRAGAASARLARLLCLRPSVWLIPRSEEVVPITLVDSRQSLDSMVATAFRCRPDLASARELLAAACSRVEKAQKEPFLPRLQVIDQAGTYGGGLNGSMGDFASRNTVSALMYWELRNLGYGNHYEILQRQAGVDQAQFQLAEVQTKLSAEVVEAAQIANAKFQALEVAELAVKEAAEVYRINQETTFNVVDAKNLFDALRPIQALQVLNQARTNYLAAILDYSRAQYRLFTALGCPTGFSPMQIPVPAEPPAGVVD
ncbi:MAG TPA: TolC family protein [Caulifigura sp.]|nr:TolC family protein [Caulifigura sp.]